MLNIPAEIDMGKHDTVDSRRNVDDLMSPFFVAITSLAFPIKADFKLDILFPIMQTGIMLANMASMAIIPFPVVL